MEADRNYANIARKTGHSGQNMQHFMSNSPWDVRRLYAHIVREIMSTPGLQDGGVLIVDESADARAGVVSAGAQKQYNGRLGNVDVSQVGVFVAYANARIDGGPLWIWVRGDLFLPEGWFADEEPMLSARHRVGIPPERAPPDEHRDRLAAHPGHAAIGTHVGEYLL